MLVTLRKGFPFESESATDKCPVLVMGASILGCGFPVAAKKISWLKVPEKVFFACKHFGTGVLIATAFVHVSLPE